MKTQVLSVGPLAAAAATGIATSQKAAGAQQLVLDGSLTDTNATAVAASQALAGAGNLVLSGGAFWNANAAAAILGQMRRIYIRSSGNDSGITFTVTGIGIPGLGGGLFPVPLVGYGSVPQFGVSEVITGANVSEVASKNLYFSISQIAVSGAVAANVQVGMQGLATMDMARQVILTSAGNDSGITFGLTGTDWANMPISETLAGANAGVAASVLSYKTISSITTSAAVASTVTAGTNGVAYSQWASFDPFAGMAQCSIQIAGTGTVNWTVQQSLDDPNSTSNPISPALMAWVNAQDPALVNSAVIAGVQSGYTFPPLWARVLLNSGSGSVRAQFVQTFLG